MHKIIIVGDGRLGKTSLLRRLRGEKFDKNEQSTRGAKAMMLTDKWELANHVGVADVMAAQQLKAEKERPRVQWMAKEKWEQDSASGSCRVCEKAFGIVCRRHHCRKCGQLVCDTCSKYAPFGITPE